MDGFTLIDVAVAAIIVVSAILAYSRGLIREVMAILGWVLAAIAAFALAPAARPLIVEIPYLGDFIGDSCELGVIAAFAAVFALALLLVSLFTPLLSGAVRDSALGGVDQALGFAFGVVRGLLLVAVALLVYDRVATAEGIAMVDDSRTANVFARSRGSIDEAVPDDAPGWIVTRYEQLVGACEG